MARLGSLLEGNEKRVDISRFIPVDCQQEGIQDYITIRKLPYIIRKKIETLSMNSISGQTGREMFKYLKKAGKNLADIDKMDPLEKMEILMSAKISDDEAKLMATSTAEIVKSTINNGVDPIKHTITGSDDKPVSLDYDTLERMGNPALIEYLVEQINQLSAGYSLGEGIGRG